MPAHASPSTPVVAPMRHTRKLAFASGALLAALAIMAIRLAVGAA